MSRLRRGRNPCPYCCIRPGTTKDHVVPECLFPKPLPNGINLVTVKACEECNHVKKSGDDAYLRDFLVMQVECLQHAGAQSLRLGEVMRSAGRNQSHFLRNLGNPRPAIVVQEQPLSVGHVAVQISVDINRLRRILAKIVRGLYFKQSHHQLPADAIFQISKVEPVALKDFLVASGGTWSRPPSLSDVFSCLYCRGPIESCLSCWVLGFYDSICFIVWTYKSLDEAMAPTVQSWEAVILPPIPPTA